MGLAMTIGQRAYEDMAVNRAKNATQNAIEAQRRQAERLGIDPSSGRWQAMENNAQLGAAAQIGAAGTQASWDWLRQAQQQNNFNLNYQLQKRGLDLRQQDMNNANYWRAKAWKMKEDDAEARADAEENALNGNQESSNSSYDFPWYVNGAGRRPSIFNHSKRPSINNFIPYF